MGFSENKMRGGVFAGILLIAVGALTFLNNLGFISFNVFEQFWPILFLLWGIAGLARSRSVPAAIWPATAVIAGAILLLANAGGDWWPFRHVSVFALWPLALIAAGAVALTSGAKWRGFAGRFTPGSTQSRLQETAIFSGVKRRVETPAFEGGELSCVFGGIEIDLRRSSMMGEATLEANAVFGGIEIRIPEEWKVVVQGFAAFGAYEDKTLPPRPDPGVVPPVLTVRGNTAFGGVSIRN